MPLPSSSPVLEVRNLSKSFKGLQALRNVNLDLREREIQGVIGPNGAGKTTLFNCLTGTVAPTAGEIVFGGVNIAGMLPAQVSKLGIARTFQNIKLFTALTVLDNVRIAGQLRTPFNLVETFISAPSFRSKEKSIRDHALDMLQVFDLEDQADRVASNLPYGAQRRLEMARALATQPKILLLDEPAAGMNETETDALHAMISGLRDRFGVSIILVEHDMRLIMNLCERITVLNYGEVIARGTPADIRQNSTVIDSYLGQVG